MQIEARNIRLPDGRRLILRSPEASDATAMIDYLKKASAETEFLIRYPEEVRYTEERERELLEQYRAAPNRVMIALFDGTRVVGDLGLDAVSDCFKVRHRASLGIAVLRSYWGLGLGRQLMETAQEQAKRMGFEQLELGVFSENLRARGLYERLGFQICGTVPRAFRLKDGSVQDEILMVKTI